MEFQQQDRSPQTMKNAESFVDKESKVKSKPKAKKTKKASGGTNIQTRIQQVIQDSNIKKKPSNESASAEQLIPLQNQLSEEIH